MNCHTIYSGERNELILFTHFIRQVTNKLNENEYEVMLCESNNRITNPKITINAYNHQKKIHINGTFNIDSVIVGLSTPTVPSMKLLRIQIEL
jgi:hypothetical protein